MFKLKVFEKIIALIANFSLLLNSFIPFLLVAQPVYGQNSEVVIPTIGYNQSVTKLDISANTSQKIAYQLFYKTDEKIDAIIGNDLNQGDFYLGTCSFSDCLPQNINRGILKIEIDSNQYRSQFFTIENNVLTVVKELDSTQSDLTVEENDFLNSSVLGDTSNWTFQNVELNKEYIAPQNSGVKLTFTKLPNNSGNIKIEEITLTPEQIEQTSALSNKAYDITSDMVDGTFEYNLSLPIPTFLNEEEVGIKYAEDINQIDYTQAVENTSETDSSILAKNLDHFTVFFIAIYEKINGNLVEQETFKKGNTVYINTAIVDLSLTKIRIKDSDNVVKKEYDSTISPISQWIYPISLSDQAGEYSIDVGTYKRLGFLNWKWVWENDVDNFYVVEGICSDGVLDPDEQCDDGSQNNQVCTPGYNSSCSYCNNECKTTILNNLDIVKPNVEIVEPSFNGQVVKSTGNIVVKYTDDQALNQIVAHLYDSNGNPVSSVWNHPTLTGMVTENIITLSLASLSDGNYTLKANTNDKANNTSSTQSRTFTIDNTLPIATIDNVPPKSLYNNSTNISVHVIDNNYLKTELYRQGESNPFKVYDTTAGSWFGLFWLVDGNYRMIIIDKAGNSTEYTFTIDKTPPTIPQHISPNNNSYINYNDFWFDWTDINDAISYEIQNSTNPTVDSNGSFVNIMWNGDYQKIQPSESKAHSVGANGTWYWQVRSVDAAGNKSAWSAPWGITIDQIVPPTPTITSPISGDYFKNTPIRATWNPVVDSSGIHQYQIKYIYQDGHKFNGTLCDGENACREVSGTQTYRDHTPNSNEQGGVTISVRAIDNAGNTSGWSNPVYYSYDSTIPTATVSYDITNLTNKSVVATLVPSEDIIVTNNSGLKNYTFEENGSFTFEFKDLAGNVGSAVASVNYIDKEKPAIPTFIEFKNPDLSCGSITNQKTITVDWSTSTDNVGVIGYDYSIDYPNGDVRGKWTTSFIQSQYRGSLNEGTHYIKVRAKDEAGNVSEWTNLCSITYDSTAPITTISNPVDSQYFNESVNILGVTQDINGVASVDLSYSPYTNGVCSDTYSPITTVTGDSSVSFSWSYNWIPTEEGNYCIKAAGTDIVGNIEHSAIVKNIIFDKTIPEVSISLNPTNPDASNGWYKTQPEITLANTDSHLDKIQYKWDNGSWVNYTAPFKLENEGAHILYYKATDLAGNTSSDNGVKNIKWDQTDLENGPQNISANPNPTSGSTSKIKWEIAKDNIGIDKYEIQWKLNDNSNPLSYSKTVGAGTTEVEIDQLIEGRWTVKVVAFDQSGKTKDNSIDVIVDRTGPIAPILTLTGTTAGTANLSWNAISDAKDYIIWYGSTQGIHQFGARVGNVTSYTVQGLGAGNYYFIIKAVDEAQNQSVDSNEVNTGTIAGAVGTIPGQPAQGFSPEVLGTNTDDQNQVENSLENNNNDNSGQVLGISTKSLLDWWWLSLLLIIPVYVIFKKVRSKKKNR